MIEVEVEEAVWTQDVPNAEAVSLRAAGMTLSHVHHDAGQDGVSILLTDDDALQDLNSRFLGKNKPTNVLSFPAPPNPEGHLGDIALAYGVCAREALEQGKTLSNHLSHLTVHGVLHLLGYDHMDDGEAEAMEAMERTVLEFLGVPDPYAAER